MSPRRAVSLVALIPCALILTACGENGASEPTAAPDTIPAATPSPIAASPPVGDQVAQVAVAANHDDIGPLPSGVFLATPPGEEVMERDAQTGPRPTASSRPQPTFASNFDADGDGFYTFAELEQAVAALYGIYEWPDSYRVNVDTLLENFAGSAERGDRFQVGYEYTILGIRHLCAWQLAWLDAYRDGDAVLMEQSLDQLRFAAAENLAFDPTFQESLVGIIERADLGDPALMQRYVDSNGNPSVFVSSDITTPPVDPSDAADHGSET